MTEPAERRDTAVAHTGLAAAWREGWRTAVFLSPDHRDVPATPTLAAGLVLLQAALSVLIERLYIDGAASFIWSSLQSGWLSTLLAAWLCWWLGRRAPAEGSGGGALFTVLAAQWLAFSLVFGALFVPLARFGGESALGSNAAARWFAWGAPIAWLAASQATLLWRSRLGTSLQRAVAVGLMVSTYLIGQWLQPQPHWYGQPPANATEAMAFRLTPEAIELQQAIVVQRLDALATTRPNRTDLYVLTYAPYADEDVFRRESEMVAAVLGARFDAAARTVQLVNHRETVALQPWATPGNLQRAIRRVAERMDRDNDILLLHLTSHGGRDGRLSASFWPLEMKELTPQMLKASLDEAGIRWRVVSVSACYSGSWIAPLADPGTLVMTAADADHTSLGCGRGADLTYFGRAMYDEQVRQGLPFEAAHAKAREVIDRREREAGKTDGGSNPQISVGAAIREPLARLEAETRQARAAN